MSILDNRIQDYNLGLGGKGHLLQTRSMHQKVIHLSHNTC